MYKKIKNLILKKSFLSICIGVFVLSFLAYALTCLMYIWQDDHAMFFKLQHIEEGSGVLGTGIYDRNSAYRFVVVPLYPLYLLFKLNPAPYFFFGIIAYAVAGLAVFFLTKSLTKNFKVAAASALIFSSGYVGAESLWRIFNSIHTTHTIIATCLTLLVYHKFIETRAIKSKILLYTLAFLLYAYTIETGYVRAHGVFLFVLALEVLFNFHLIKSFLRMAPFAALFYWFYILTVVASRKAGWLFESLWIEKKFELLLVPLKVVENLFVPDYFKVPLVLFLGLMFIVFIKARSRALFFAAAIAFANLAVYFLNTPDQVLPSTHRYLSLSLIGMSMFTAVAAEKIFKEQRIFLLIISGIIGLHILSVNYGQYKIVRDRSIPGRNFYTTLKKEIPELPKGSALYFDIQDHPKTQSEFASFFGVGSMPDMAAIAVQYGIDRYDLTLPQTFNELLTQVRDGQVAPDKVYTFHYSSTGGLVNTTNQTRDALFGNPKEMQEIDLKTLEIPSTTPVLVKVTLTSKVNDQIKQAGETVENLEQYISYLASREQFYKTNKTTVRSEWKYSEVKYINDQDKSTTWMGHRGKWHFEEQEYVQIDLGRPVLIGAIRRTNGGMVRAPIDYIYYCSQDGNSWQEVAKFTQTPKTDFEEIVDKLNPITCRYIKMDIKETISDDSPQLAEIEVVEDRFKDLDFKIADKISSNPFSFAVSSQERKQVEQYLLQKGAKAELCFHPRNFLNSKCYSFQLPVGATSSHELVVTPRGVSIGNVEAKSILGLDVIVDTIEAKTLSFEELKERGYIFEHSQN